MLLPFLGGIVYVLDCRKFLFTTLIIIITFEIATYFVRYKKCGHEKS